MPQRLPRQHRVLPFLEQRWGADGLTYPEQNARGVRARPSTRMTVETLERLGVRCPNYGELEIAWGQALLEPAA